MYSLVPLHLGLHNFGISAYGVFQCIPELFLPSFGEIMGIVWKYLANREKNVFLLLLRPTINEVFLYPLSVYVRQALYEFLRLHIGLFRSMETFRGAWQSLQSGV
jgi:hypothetical protein